jgi:Putative adhesin
MSNSGQGITEETRERERWREMNSDPREQPGIPPHDRGFPSGARSPRGHSRWFWLGVSVVILVAIYGGLATAGAVLTHDITTSKVVEVSAAPKLILTLPDGSVHLASGPDGQMSVVMHQQVLAGENNPIPAQFVESPDGNTLTITVKQNFTVGLNVYSTGTNFDIVAPQNTVMVIHTGSGNITANGFDTSMTLQTSNGDISTNGGSVEVALTSSNGNVTARNASGQVTLASTSGDVTAINDTGTLALSTSSGNVTATNAAATGDSSFETANGNVSYSGTLAPNTNDEFHTSNGDVALTLPTDAAFQIRASTSDGSIDSAFASVIPEGGPLGTGAVAIGLSGNSPYADISIQDGVGNIRLRAS